MGRMSGSSSSGEASCPHVEPVVYTAAEVAAMLRLTRDQVRLATVNGALPHRQLGASARTIRYTRADIDSFLECQARTGLRPASHAAPAPPVVMPAPSSRRRAVDPDSRAGSHRR